MAGVAVERGRRGFAHEHGGNEHVWHGIGPRIPAVVGNLVARKRQKAGGIYCPLGEITDRDGGFEISRRKRRNDEIHSGDLHFQFGGPQVVRFAIIARGCAGAGNRPGKFSQCARPGRNQNCAGRGRYDAQAKTGVRVATGAVGVAGFQQCADEHSRSYIVAVEQGRGRASVATR